MDQEVFFENVSPKYDREATFIITQKYACSNKA